jgi:hypothetical protein
LLAEQGTWLSPQRAHLESTIRRQPSKSEFLTWPSQKQTKERATAVTNCSHSACNSKEDEAKAETRKKAE